MKYVVLWELEHDDFLVVREDQVDDFPYYMPFQTCIRESSALIRQLRLIMLFWSPEDLEGLPDVTPNMRKMYWLAWANKVRNQDALRHAIESNWMFGGGCIDGRV